jgi:hypothetical protein
MIQRYELNAPKYSEREQDVSSLCYASELMERFDFTEAEMNAAIQRAFSACSSLNISIGKNFRSVFRNAESCTSTDWHLSPLACYLLIINADPSRAEIAKLQLLFATKKFTDVNIF